MDETRRNAELRQRLLLPFPLLSDPDGRAIKEYGLWEERGLVTPLTGDRAPMSIPGIVVTDVESIVRYVYTGSDFADRPGDKVVFDALRENVY